MNTPDFKRRYAAALAAEDSELVHELECAAREYAYERACELDSPNSPGFDALRESIFEELLS